MIEVWKETPYENYYISNFGRFKGRTNKILKQHIGKTGYYMINIYPNGRIGKSKTLKIHRVVAEAFIPNSNNYPVVNHKDGNKLNNNVENLEWCTHSYNTKHAFEHNLSKPKKGCSNSNSKLSEDDVKWIREHYIPRDRIFGTRALARKFNMSHANISRLVNKVRYKD